jgi:serine/threonine protein kinase/Tol biopolymer transport system component
MIGTKLAHYEFVGHLGSGGMGNVWRAMDTKLGREVAIKTLSEDVAPDAESLARLQREARLLATLKHPGIAAIYGLEEQQGMRFLVLELVEGETLAERLRRGPLPLEDALRLARQIADALEAAHEKGIIHRDLKPANIKITPDDATKVLDFGIAKTIPRTQSDESVTASVEATEAGMILGTVAYMSPEQARGKAVDKRTDVWAFGVVLYELLTGERPFQGADSNETLINILTQKPDLQRIPPTVRRLLAKCLEKDPKKRLRDLGDAWDLLDDASTHSGLPAHTRLTWILGFAAVALLIALSVVSFLYFNRRVAPEGLLRYSIAAPEGSGSIHSFAISPNGRTLAIAATVNGKRQLWLRKLDALQAAPLPFTEDATYPFWSPDSSSIGFFAQGHLKRVAATGGPAESLCPVPDPRGGSWNRDGVIVFSSSFGWRTPIQRIQAAGGTPADLTEAQGDYTNPIFLPDGQHFLLVRRRGEETGIYVRSLDGKEMRRILPDVSSVVYVAPSSRSSDGVGRLLFVRDNALMAQPFDAGSAKLRAEASVVVKGVSLTANNIYAPVTASETGVLVYDAESKGTVAHMDWFDRTGQMQGEIGTEGDGQPAISPDGKAVIFARGTALWLRDLDRGTDRIVTSDNEMHGSPHWSPSRDRIVFGLYKNGIADLYQKRQPTLSSPEELLVTSAYSKAPMQLSNGFLVYQEFNPKTKRDIWFLPVDASAAAKPQTFLQTPSDELFPQLSPDGRWMAYTSDISGRREVWVRAFPAADRETQISTEGGEQPRWRGDGKELFFEAGDGKLNAVSVNMQGDLFTASAPGRLFDMHLAQTENGAQFQYDVSADGNRFLIVTRGTADKAPLLSVIANWSEESSIR